MKKYIIALSAALMMFTAAVHAEDDIRVIIDGTFVDFGEYDNVMPYIDSGRTLIPIRAVAEGLGAKVDWDADNEIATIDNRIELEINNDVAIVDGKQIIMDVPAQIKSSRTFVPIRFVSENMGARVEWINDSRTVKITTAEKKTENKEENKEETAQTETKTETAAQAEQDAVYNNVVYMGVKNYGTQSADLKDYYQHRFFKDGKVYEYPVLRDDNYTLQNKLAEGYVYNIKVENGVVTSIDESSATTGKIEKIDGTSLTLTGEKRAINVPNLYSVTTAAGSVKVEEAKPAVGNTVSVYSSDTAYMLARGSYTPAVQNQAGLKTIKNFLATGMQPVGHTLYIYGGGWNWQDKGSSNAATSIGVSSKWADFFDKNNADYTYRTEQGPTTYYPHNGVNQYYFAGLDCSGFVGWTIYNTLNTQNGAQGYVMASTQMAKTFAQQYNFGTWTQDVRPADFKPGDIMSMNGHAWIFLGACADGSAVILESAPSKSINNAPGGGVQLSALGDTTSQAAALAEQYMKKYYPEWSQRYPVNVINYNSYTSFTGDTAGRFTWNSETLSDPDGYLNMTAEQILKNLFNEN